MTIPTSRAARSSDTARPRPASAGSWRDQTRGKPPNEGRPPHRAVQRVQDEHQITKHREGSRRIPMPRDPEGKPQPLAWKDKPALIEVAFPVQKISLEAQCERKQGQAKPLRLSAATGRDASLSSLCARASLPACSQGPTIPRKTYAYLSSCWPSTIGHSASGSGTSARTTWRWGGELSDLLIDQQGSWKIRGEEKLDLLGRVLCRLPYSHRLDRRSLRPEELPPEAYDWIWSEVHEHLGIDARSHGELVEKLGILRFGHRPLSRRPLLRCRFESLLKLRGSVATGSPAISTQSHAC